MPRVQNVLTGEFMHVTAEGPVTFTGCTVTAPAGKGCVVANVGGSLGLLRGVPERNQTNYWYRDVAPRNGGDASIHHQQRIFTHVRGTGRDVHR